LDEFRELDAASVRPGLRGRVVGDDGGGCGLHGRGLGGDRS